MKNHNFKFHLCSVILLTLITAFNAATASSETGKNWQFKVFLNDDEIGFHHFSMINKGENKEIYSKARFNVKFFFINAYSYQHDNVEHWHRQCLKSISAITNDNGEQHKVSGKIDNDAFIVNTRYKRSSYLPCVKTFAYWDPEFLKESTLLNSQTGEMINVKSEFIGNETLTHKGQAVDARRYRLSAENLQIDLWYSDEDHWLALESLTEDGRIVRYAIP